MLSRRNFNFSILAATASVACSQGQTVAQIPSLKEHNMSQDQDIDWSGLSEAQWKDRLPAQAFTVLRKEGTERPFTSPLNDEKRDGTFVCAGCALPLFSAKAKYDSGTGWPSFFRPLEGAIKTKKDFKLVLPRTEYHCARCGGHQGHVFKDGPKPTGLRYCNNGVALDFIPA